MARLLIIAVGALALSGGAVLAQTNSSDWLPSGPGSAPGGANGAAPMISVGDPSANARDTVSGGSRSTSLLSQSNKNQSAAGLPSTNYNSGRQVRYEGAPSAQQSQAQIQGRMIVSDPTDNPRATVVTDEFGNRYNSRGERIGRR